jgi:hypothetical protein
MPDNIIRQNSPFMLQWNIKESGGYHDKKIN